MDTTATTDFVHIHEPGSDAARPPLLLLHGTGGDERDLLGLGRAVAPGATLLSPRGKVLEGPMPRFFRRLSEGVFDEDDLRRRTHELADFVETARERYGPRPAGRARLFERRQHRGQPSAAAAAGAGRAALLRAMSPFAEPPEADLGGKRVLILSGAMDPIVPAADVGRLARTLSDHGASVDHRTLPAGHGLSQADINLLAGWFAA